MNDQVKGTLVGDPVDAPIAPPKSRAERIEDWRDANRAAYHKVCNEVQCTCTPTRAQALIMNAWDSPPVD